MKLCAAIPCFFGGLPFEAAVEKAAALGYRYVEIYDWKSLNLPSAKQALEEAGVTLLSMCTTEFRLTDPACRALWLSGLKESCAAAQALGVQKLITQVFGNFDIISFWYINNRISKQKIWKHQGINPFFHTLKKFFKAFMNEILSFHEFTIYLVKSLHKIIIRLRSFTHGRRERHLW